MPVHPHARGDDGDLASHGPTLRNYRFTPTGVGKTSAYTKSQARRQRFTPTRVGTTAPRRRRRARPTVHPHARGDDRGVQGARPRPRGSPPRAWGRLPMDTSVGLVTVHPHSRGDDFPGVAGAPSPSVHPTRVGTTGRGAAGALPQRGSPPRAWGRPVALGAARGRRRFTPTRVGTTTSSSTAPCPQRGSPPRAWGRLALGPGRRRRTVHPHARGDDPLTVRGAGGGSRFTPTRGDDRPPPRFTASPAVHPHARGDDLVATLAEVAPERFTPTRVGTTPSEVERARARRRRFTPTRGGDDRDVRRCPRASRLSMVHPHARGDDEHRPSDSCLACLTNVRGSLPTRVGTT